jgi:hypothetical protein
MERLRDYAQLHVVESALLNLQALLLKCQLFGKVHQVYV